VSGTSRANMTEPVCRSLIITNEKIKVLLS